ncbi:MAG: protein translocase subunit SecF [bacterium]|nr:protein translocase subunit SecF [bacterium]
MINIFKNSKYDFIGKRKYAYILSLAIIIPGIVSFIVKGGPKYGIDFTGGSLVRLHFEQPIPISDLRAKLSQMGFKEAVIQEEKGTKYDYLIKTYPKEGIGNQIAKLFTPSPTVVQEDLVGPAISENFRQKAIWVVLLCWACMLVYIWIRFQFRWGVCAVISIVHDLILTAGLLSILNKEFTASILAALLTIIGYSINDSIVISDRIRENKRLLRKVSLADLVNTSINETLSRTIITGLSTMFVLVILFFFGGPVIHDFAFTMLIGIVVGTYSSVYVVAALVVDWDLWSSKKKIDARSSK